jgi:ABC-type lipoprotein export system ATPase subunit
VGQQQRIARAIIKEPRLILADESNGEMDPLAEKEISEKLIELNKKSNNTLIVTSHGIFPYNKADRLIY